MPFSTNMEANIVGRFMAQSLSLLFDKAIAKNEISMAIPDGNTKATIF